MKQHKLWRHGALAIVAAILTLGAAGSTWAAELVVWHAYRGQERDAFEKAIGMFNEKFAGDGISAKTLAVPFDAYADKITAAVPRGRGPDVFIFAQDRLGGWVEGGQTVEPIDFYVEDNKALIDEPPATTSELVATAKEHTNASVGKFGLAYEYSNYFFHAALMNGMGGRVFDPGPTPTINLPENIKAIDLMMRWYTEDKILPADPSSALISTLFNGGNAAMVLSGPWFVSEIESGVDFGLAPLPTCDECGGEPLQPWLTVEGIYISAGSQNSEQAYELLKFLVSEEPALVMALEGRQQPSNKAVYDNPEVINDPVLSAFRKQLETAVPMPNYAEMTLMWSPVTTAMNKIVKGSASAQSAMDEAQKTITTSIEALRRGR
jgi:arabinogalactan oligomer/maltooligosaccharide transport system substrate-binding protein